MKRAAIFYIVFISSFLFLVWFILNQGRQLDHNIAVFQGTEHVSEHSNNPPASEFNLIVKNFFNNFTHPLSTLLLQIIVIVIFSRLIGSLFRKIGQPLVIGEIFAGIILGPSVLGIWFPQISSFLFPPSSLNNLQFLSQIGLILFMFIIGMELEVNLLKNRAHEAVLLSHTSIIVPYFLGVLISYFIFESYVGQGVTFISFALFMGIAMSITAFPVLARIVQEKELTKTSLGILALTCAAADDITAWCLLAVVIAIVKAGTILSALSTIVLALTYVVFMLKVLQPLLKKISSTYVSAEHISKTVIAFIFIVLLFSSYLTEIIGIHALFGAFLAGVIIPKELNLKTIIAEKIEDVSLILLLPLFFVYTGLRTQIGLLNDVSQWLVCLLLIIVAVAGKFGGSTIAAKFVGQSWKNSLSLGILMNTRGLMELIVLNIGFDLGVLSPQIFTMMVIMAIATTFMTGPLLSLVNRFSKEEMGSITGLKTNRILISFGRMDMGKTLLLLSRYLAGKNGIVKMLHVDKNPQMSILDPYEHTKEYFEPIFNSANQLSMGIEPIYRISDNVRKEVLDECEKSKCNLLLLGGAKSIFSENILGGKIKHIIKNSPSNTGILLNNNFHTLNTSLFVINEPADVFLVKYAKDFLTNSDCKIIFHDPANVQKTVNYTKDFPSDFCNRISVTNFPMDEENLKHNDLIVTSLSYWNSMLSRIDENIQVPVSILIMKNK